MKKHLVSLVALLSAFALTSCQTTEPSTPDSSTSKPTEPSSTTKPSTPDSSTPDSSKPTDPEEPETVDPIATIDSEAKYNVKGVVKAKNDRGMLISDETGSVYIHFNNDTLSNYALNDYVSVSGTTNSYYSSYQFTVGDKNDTVIEKLSETAPEITHTATPLTAEIANSFVVEDGTILPRNSIKLYSWTTTVSASGNYKAFNVEGSEVSLQAVYNNELNALAVGTALNLEGYFLGYNPKSKYAAFVATNYEEVEAPAPTYTPAKVNEITEAGNFSTTGKVMAINDKAFVLADETGSMYVHLGAKYADYQSQLSVGKALKVEGTVSSYNGFYQYNGESNAITITDAEYSTEITHTATSLTAEFLNTLPTAGESLARDSFKLYSWSAVAGKAGNFLTFNLPDSEVLVEPSYQAYLNEEIKVGTPYNLEGYFVGYNSKHNFASFIFTKHEEVKATSLEITGPKEVKVNEHITLTAAVTPSTVSQEVTWESLNPEIASVTNGDVTGLAAGAAKIKATSVSNPDVSAEYDITVKANEVYATDLTVTPETLTITRGKTATLTHTVAPETISQSVTYSIAEGGNEIVSIDEKGVVTALKAGSTTITVSTVAKNAEGASITKAVPVTVEEPAKVESVNIRFEDYMEGMSNSYAEQVIHVEENNTTITFSSANSQKQNIQQVLAGYTNGVVAHGGKNCVVTITSDVPVKSLSAVVQKWSSKKPAMSSNTLNAADADPFAVSFPAEAWSSLTIESTSVKEQPVTIQLSGDRVIFYELTLNF